MNIGKIVSIEYSKLQVRIATEIRGGSVNLRGEIYYFGNIGGYLKTTNAVDETIVCEVISILDSDPNKEQSFNVESERSLILKPLGTLVNDKFQLGISIYPSLYSNVSILTYEDMEKILGVVGNELQKSELQSDELKSGESKDNTLVIAHKSFDLGTSKNLINYPISIKINDFFQIHTAVLGNSGSGKSTTIASILQDILKKKNYAAHGAKIIIFDVNGEYETAFPEDDFNDKLEVKHYSLVTGSTHKKFLMPHFLLNLEEWCSFLIAAEATQRPFWNRVLTESYRFYMLTKDSSKTEIFAHYFADRICSMVRNVLTQVDNDTSKITAANGLIRSIKNLTEDNNLFKTSLETIIAEDPLNEKCTIKNILNELSTATLLEYGNNNDSLIKAVDQIFKKIDREKVKKALNYNLKNNFWYSHKFLKISAEMILIEEDTRGNKSMRNWTSTMMTRLEHFLDNPECQFMREEGRDTPKSREEFLKQMFGIGSSEDKAQLTIINVSTLSPDILETLTSVVARTIFDYRKDEQISKRTKNPVHLILDEAHRYVKKDRTYLLKENIFEKIAREGRKYAYYLLVSSQRPSELSETVLSQCGNYIVHRIQNDKDMNYIKAIMPFFSQDFVDKIRQSIPGEAIVFGNCVPMPLQVSVNKASPEPDSKNCVISEQWFREKKAKSKEEEEKEKEEKRKIEEEEEEKEEFPF